MAKRRTFRKKSYRKKKRVVRRRTAKKTTRVVKRVLSRIAETKSVQQYNYGTTLVPTSSAAFDTTNVIRLGPWNTTMPINQGTGAGNRVGNKITTKNLTIRGAVIPLPYNVTTNPTPRPMLVTLYFFYDKQNPNSVPTPQSNADFFQNGNGAATFDSDLIDNMAPVNSDRYRVFTKRTLKVGWANYESMTGTSTPFWPSAGGMSNNDFKMLGRFKVNLRKYFPKIVKYNDTFTGSPTIRSVYMMTLVNWADGNPMASTAQACGLQFIHEYKYQDL